MLNKQLPSVDPSHFALVPRSDVPRSKFETTHTHKLTFDTGYLIPIHVEEVIPSGAYEGELFIFARLNNLLFPLMDNARISTFAFFVASRNLWDNFTKMMGEQANPGDSIAFTVPQHVSPAGGWAPTTVYDYFGIPVAGQITAGQTISINALPLRAYYQIWNEWFRDEDLQNSLTVPTNDGPDAATYGLQRRNKRPDYFTSARPWPLKGGIDQVLPLGGSATVRTNSSALITAGSQTPLLLRRADTGAIDGSDKILDHHGGTGQVRTGAGAAGLDSWGMYPSNLYADLSTATGATINSMRLAVASQQFLEKDARGGTRYTELLRNHFGVQPEDGRLQRPEYIGGGVTEIKTQAIPQTSATGLTGGTTPIGALTAQAVAAGAHRFSYHATEHGYIIILACVDADITYQQGLHRMWTRSTRFDFYWPTFANLGEQAIRNDEIYCTGTDATDTATFGYQERWSEYRYYPSRISGLFRSTSTGNIDEWHLAQQFLALPALNSTFIPSVPPAARVLAAGAAANGMQVLFDSFWKIRRTLPLPVYSVPGLKRF